MGLGNAYDSLGQYREAIEFHQRSLAIFREIGNRKDEADSLMNLSRVYSQTGRVAEGITASNEAARILQELDLPIDAYPYPNWVKSLAKFANRSRWHLALCFFLGVFAFPFGLAWLILLSSFRLLRRWLRLG